MPCWTESSFSYFFLLVLFLISQVLVLNYSSPQSTEVLCEHSPDASIHASHLRRPHSLPEPNIPPIGTLEDPLDDSLFLEGDFGKALTIENAKLCDEKLNMVFSDSWRCKDDDTCRKCTGPYIKAFKSLEDAFMQPELVKKRKESVLARFKSTVKPIYLFALNYGQLYLFLNWACSAESIRLNAREHAVIVTTDSETEEVLRKFGFLVFDSSWTEKLEQKISSSYRGSAMTGPHAQINNVILLAGNEIIQEGYDVVFHDVDIAWRKDPSEWLFNASRRRDVLGMLAPTWTAKGVINSGFVYVRSSVQGRRFVQSLVNLSPLKKVSDQILWNTVLRHLYFGQLSSRILPQKLFYKYNGHKSDPPSDDVLLFHAVGNSKRTHLDYYGFWRFTDTCSFYSNEIDKISSETVQEKASSFYKTKPG